MPYLPSEAAKKSKVYSNILNGPEIEYQKEIDFLKQQQAISGSVDANTPLRDDEGFLVSFEGETPGVSLEEEFEQVRLENAQYFFEGEIDNEFTHYFQPEEDPDEDDEEEDNATEEATDEQVEFQMTKRDNLIQVMNVYFNEEFTPDISTDKLHSLLKEFFNIEGKRPPLTLKGFVGNKKKFKNAEGWEDLEKINLVLKDLQKKEKRKDQVEVVVIDTTIVL